MSSARMGLIEGYFEDRAGGAAAVELTMKLIMKRSELRSLACAYLRWGDTKLASAGEDRPVVEGRTPTNARALARTCCTVTVQ